MNKIAVFGASGKTGVPFIKQAVQIYQVKALVRNPEKLPFVHKNLEIIKGNILNPSDVDRTIEGTQAVVSLISHFKGSPENLQTKATEHILASMKKQGIKRLISLTGGGVRDDAHDNPGIMDHLIVFVMKNLAGKGSRNALLDGVRHAELIRQSNLDWTLVRCPLLTDLPPTGRYEVGYVGKAFGYKLTRGDLASFILDILKKNSHIKDMPFLANR